MKTIISRIMLCVILWLISVWSAFVDISLLVKSGLNFSEKILYTICFLGWPICILFIIITLIKQKPEDEVNKRLKTWKITLSIFTIIFGFLFTFTDMALEEYLKIDREMWFLHTGSFIDLSIVIGALFKKGKINAS